MMRAQAVVCVAGMWAISSGLFVASGVALRAVLRRRLVLGSRLPGLRQGSQVLKGREALRVSISLLTVSLALALFFLAIALVTTFGLSRSLTPSP